MATSDITFTSLPPAYGDPLDLCKAREGRSSGFIVFRGPSVVLELIRGNRGELQESFLSIALSFAASHFC